MILGAAHEKIEKCSFPKRVVLRVVLYELFLLGEEVLYMLFIKLVLDLPITWERVSGTFLSPANPLLLLVLLAYCVWEKSLAEDGNQDRLQRNGS